MTSDRATPAISLFSATLFYIEFSRSIVSVPTYPTTIVFVCLLVGALNPVSHRKDYIGAEGDFHKEIYS